MASQAEIRAVDNAIFADPNVSTFTASPEINLWDRILLTITPESYAESIVNEIYSSPQRSLKPDPYYNPADLTKPAVYVTTKETVKDFAGALSGFATGGLLTFAAFALIAIAIYAAIPVLLRR
jgi:hypothetical protein